MRSSAANRPCGRCDSVGRPAGRRAACRARSRRPRAGCGKSARAPPATIRRRSACRRPTCWPSTSIARAAARAVVIRDKRERDGDPLHLPRRRLRPVEDDGAHAALAADRNPGHLRRMLPFHYRAARAARGRLSRPVKAAFNHDSVRTWSCPVFGTLSSLSGLGPTLGRPLTERPYFFAARPAY